MPKKFLPEVRDRAVRMSLDRLSDHPTGYPSSALAPKFGLLSNELEEIKKLKTEDRDSKEANEIRKAASILFARELDPRHH